MPERFVCGSVWLCFILLLVIYSGVASANCSLPGGEWQELVYVYDGDTLKLKDGRKVRVLGVNTPELERKHEWGYRPAEPLAAEAKRAAQGFFAGSKRIRLVYDKQAKDRYKRTLAYVFDERGGSLESYLLRRGLAFHIAIPPNIALAECLAEVEVAARQQKLGVWSDENWPHLPAAEVGMGDAGFQRIRGRVASISTGKTLWLELDGNVVLKVSATDRGHYPNFDWSGLQGRQLEVTGWLVDRGSKALARGHKRFVMPLRSPYAVQLLTTAE